MSLAFLVAVCKSKAAEGPSLLKARPGVDPMGLPVHSGEGKLGRQPRFRGKTGHLLMGRTVCRGGEGKN